MGFWTTLANRIRHLAGRGQFDWELEQEIRFHIETRADELEWEGLSREEALRQAHREFGSVTRAEEDSRAAWRFQWLEELAADLRYGARVLGRSPGFTVTAVISLALGIGANTTVFSLVKAALMSQLPVREPERLVSIHQGGAAVRLSFPDFQDYRRQVTAFEGLAASYAPVPGSLAATGEPERLWGQLVTTDFFPVLGAEPRLGRGFRPEENESAVVVISDALWRDKFGADPEVIGKTVRLRGANRTVVGVAPAEFHGSLRGLRADFWLPLGLYPTTVPQIGQGATGRAEEDRNYGWLYATARLKRGVTVQAAASALRAAAQRLDESYPKRRGKRTLALAPADALPMGLGQARTLLGLLLAVVGLVLMVACANVANLLLARSAARRSEMGIRLAIGAGRARLVRQLLTECALLSAAGAASGVALAWAATRALERLQSSLPIQASFDVSIDARVLGLTASVAVFTTLLFGLAPALRGTRVEPGPMAKAGEEALAGGWLFGLRNSLIVGQVAVSLVLLVGAGLFLRSLRAASAAPLGMEPQNVLVASFDPRAAGYSNERAAGLFRRLTESVRAMPGVESASVTDTLPLSYMPGAVGVARPGSDDTIIADIYGVTPQHFRTLGIPLRQGQDLAEQQEGVPQLVINEAAAARLFGAENPVGAALDWEGMRHLVAGVARNAKSRSTGEPARPQIFVPLEKEYRYFWGLSGVTLCVRTRDGAGGLLPLIESRIRETEPDLAIYNAGTMPEHVDRALVIPRLCSWLFGIFGGVALLLAAVGLYGVMSYSVRRRSREIGIRLAIGARPAQLARMLAWQGLGLAAAGAALGLAAAGAVSRVLAGFLFGVGSRDPLTFAAVPLVLAATALAAVLIPAARAVRADALRSIRYE